MNQFGQIFLDLLLFIYNTIAFQNLGVAVIEIGILSRLIFYPFIKQQTHYTRKMAELQPHIKALKEKHKGNQQAFAQAQMELFKEHNVNPAAGCLPSIVQLVVLIGLYGAIGQLAHKAGINVHFAIWNMATPDTYSISGVPFPIPGILVIMAAATQFIQTKMMLTSSPASQKLGEPKEVANPKKEEKKDGEFMSEFASAQSSMIWMFPLLFLFLGTQKNFPSALALYWSVSSLLMIAQQYRIGGLGGLEQYVVKLRKFTGK